MHRGIEGPLALPKSGARPTSLSHGVRTLSHASGHVPIKVSVTSAGEMEMSLGAMSGSARPSVPFYSALSLSTLVEIQLRDRWTSATSLEGIDDDARRCSCGVERPQGDGALHWRILAWRPTLCSFGVKVSRPDLRCCVRFGQRLWWIRRLQLSKTTFAGVGLDVRHNEEACAVCPTMRQSGLEAEMSRFMSNAVWAVLGVIGCLTLGIGVSSCEGVEFVRPPAFAVEALVPTSVPVAMDTYVADTAPNTNSGTSPVLSVVGGGATTALLYVDPLAVNTSVPVGNVILAARLEVLPTSAPANGTYTVHRVGRTWSAGTPTTSGATFNCPVDPNTADGLINCVPLGWSPSLYVAAPLSAVTVSGYTAGTWLAFDVTAEAQSMVVAGATHPGFLIRDNGGTVSLHSVEAAPANRPRLVIYHAPPGFSVEEPATASVPPLDRGAVTNVYDGMAFLLDPARGLQWGFTPGVFTQDRAAVIRGRVYHAGGGVLDQVEISVLNHAEFGRTRSRVATGTNTPTGNYEIMVNGGGPLVLRFSRAGFFDVERRIEVPWNQWLAMPEVAMTPRPAGWPATGCVANSAGSGVLGWGPNSTGDGRGNRRTGFFIPSATSAAGDASFRLCAAEYTVASPGPFDRERMMPGDLTATTSYTYASEVEVYGDTTPASLIGAPTFTNGAGNRVYQYLVVDGALSMPPGTVIPNGSFSRSTGEWLPDPDGVVFHVIRTPSFSIDSEPGTTDDNIDWAPGELAAIEADTANLPHNAVVWRVPRTHFSPIDLNLRALLNAFFNPFGAGANPNDQGSCRMHSIIGCEAGSLGEVVPLRGTPFALRYQSDHQWGFRTAYTARFQLDDDGLADGTAPTSALSRVRVTLEIAGRRLPDNGALAPGLVVTAASWTPAVLTQLRTIEWDGLDAYGRIFQGPQVGYLRYDYEYDGAAYRPPATPAPSGSEVCTLSSYCQDTFGAGSVCMSNRCTRASSFASPVDVSADISATGRATISYTRRVTLGVVDDERRGFLGWGLSEHHLFDPATSTVHFADGSRRSSESTGRFSEVVSGTYLGGTLAPRAVTVGADGDAYFVAGEGSTLRIYRLPRAGGTPVLLTTTVTERNALTSPTHLAIDGSRLWVANAAGGVDCVYALNLTSTTATLDARRIGACGVAEVNPLAPGFPFTTGGTPTPRTAGLGAIVALEQGRDGLYIGIGATGFPELPGIVRFREDGTADGLLERIADGFSNNWLTALDVGPDGSVYFAATYDLGAGAQYGIYRRGPEGVITRWVGGAGGVLDRGEGAPRLLAEVGGINHLEVGPAGDLYYVETLAAGGDRLRVVTANDLVVTLAGPRTEANGTTINSLPSLGCNVSPLRDPAVSTRVGLTNTGGLAFLPDGTALLAQSLLTDSCIARVRAMVPGGFLGEHRVASEGGSMVYVFSATGRHLRTENALTGTALVSFGYGTDGRVTSITDAENVTTTVTYGASTITLATNGMDTVLNGASTGRSWASSISLPGGDTVSSLIYDTTQLGLLRSFSDARGFPHSFNYETANLAYSGRLREDRTASDSTMPTPGTTVYLGLPSGTGTATAPTSVTFTTAGGLASNYLTWTEDGVLRGRTTHRGTVDYTIPPDGRDLVVARTVGTDVETVTYTTAPDPRATLAGVRFMSSARLDRAIAPDVYLGASRTEGATAGEYTQRIGIDSVSVSDPSTVDNWFTNVDQVGSEWVTTHTPPAGSTWNTVVRRDSRGRVIRIDLPSTHPICITYPTSTAVRPSLVRQSADCTALPTRRDVALTWDTRRRLWTVTSGYDTTTLPSTLSYSTDRPFATAIRAPGHIASNEAVATYDAHGNLTRFEPHGLSATERHTFVLGGRQLLESYTSPASGTAEISGVTYTSDGDLDSAALRGGMSIDPVLTAGLLDGVTGSPNLGFYDVTSDVSGRIVSAIGPDGTTAFTYDGSALRTQTWTLGTGGTGVTGAVTAVLSGAVTSGAGLLDYEDVTLQAPLARIDYGYGTSGATRRLRTSGAIDVAPLGSADRTVTVTPSVSTTAGESLLVAAGSTLSGVTINATTALDDFLEHRTTNVVAGTSTMYWEQTCTRDAVGHITRRAETTRDTVGAAPTDTVYEYQYDTFGRLSAYRVIPNCWCTLAASSGCASPAWTNYSYDAFGNRSDTHYGAPLLDDRVNGGLGSPSRSYDGPGRTLTVGADETHTWDELGRVTRTSRTLRPSGTVVIQDFDYDALGRLIAVRNAAPNATYPNQRFIYRDGLRPIAWAYQTSAAGAWNTAYFVYASEGRVPDMMGLDLSSNGTLDSTYRFATDARGSIRVMLNHATGNAIQRVAFNAWGVETRALNVDRIHPFGFAGGISMGHESLTLFGARVYDARNGRWLSKDPISFYGGHNLYVYCNNDPVNCVDPTGLSAGSCFLQGLAAGAAGALVVAGLAAGALALGAPVAAVTIGLAVAGGFGAAAFMTDAWVDVDAASRTGNWDPVWYDGGTFLGGMLGGRLTGGRLADTMNIRNGRPDLVGRGWSLSGDRLNAYNPRLGTDMAWWGTGPDSGAASGSVTFGGAGIGAAAGAGCGGDCN